mmetsp:Transcript_6937/g.19468  ORF Transcript_6937/g.19468 Transcript_6937/m.19468 type:complete len:150 (+) Transcript_6937:220-669(+)
MKRQPSSRNGNLLKQPSSRKTSKSSSDDGVSSSSKDNNTHNDKDARTKVKRTKSAPLKVNPATSLASQYVDTLPPDDTIGRTKRAFDFYCANGRMARSSLLQTLQGRHQTAAPGDNLPTVDDIKNTLPWNFNGTVVNEFKLMKMIALVK